MIRNFFLTYGDGVGNVDIAASLAFHRKHGKKLTVSAVCPPGRFGELGIAKDGQVFEFNEKPPVRPRAGSMAAFSSRRALYLTSLG